MNKVLSILIAFAACGGGASKPAAKPEPTAVADPVPMPSPPSEPSPAQPVEPPEPPAPDPAKIKAGLLAAEIAAYDNAKPVFDKFCAGCHSKGKRGAKAKTLGHFEMTTYPFTGHHAMELGTEIRKVLAIGGGKPTMPKSNPGAVKGDDLALIATWADAFDASHAGGAHEGQGHDHGGKH